MPGVNVVLAAGLQAGEGAKAGRGQHDGEPRRPACARTHHHDPPSGDWEDRHVRVTFHCPRDLLDLVEAEVGRSGRSKSRVITDALREHLAEG